MNKNLAFTLTRAKNNGIREGIDADPVMHGRWKWILGKPYCECCAIEPYRAINNEMPNYCPNCGAKMAGGNDND